MKNCNSGIFGTESLAARERFGEVGIQGRDAAKGLRSTQRKGRVVGIDKAALIAPLEVPRPAKVLLCLGVGRGLWWRVAIIIGGKRR